jgi:hypothetical protein
MRNRERGGVTMLLILVLLILSALLGTLAVRGASSELQMAGSQRVNRTAFYCAEAGLNAARPILGAQYGQWNTLFSGGAATGFVYPVVGDLDGDGQSDFRVTIEDNLDELAPALPDPSKDNDLTAILTSRCISPTLGSRTLQQIVTYSARLGTDYRYQAGHSSTHSGNAN